MSSCLTKDADVQLPTARRLNPAELKIGLLCSGVKIEKPGRIERLGLPLHDVSNGFTNELEMILPGGSRDLWVRASVREKSVGTSPFCLLRGRGGPVLLDERNGLTYDIRLPGKPDWYDMLAPSGTPMSRIGMLDGTYLAIDIGEPRRLEGISPPVNGGSGNADSAGSGDTVERSIQDVTEIAAIAQKKSGVTFVLLHDGDRSNGGISKAFPYLKALKHDVGILVGLRFPPEENLALYDEARSLGVDHLSFSIECFNADSFQLRTQGKVKPTSRDCFLRSLEHCSQAMGKGRVSCKLVAGIEPAGDTIHGIDYLAEVGALPLVRVFQPVEGTESQNDLPADYDEMLHIYRHVCEACRRNNLPIGILPNVHLSALLHPEDTLYLACNSAEVQRYERWIHTMKQVMRPYYLRRMRRHQLH